MKITVLTGSPHKNGTTSILAQKFIEGAIEAGHEIFQFDCSSHKVKPCLGCDQCQYGKNACILKDDMHKLYSQIINADLIAFITPLYYHSYSAQLKTVIDRFHGIDDLIRGTNKKAVLLVAGASDQNWIMDGLVTTYHTQLRYLGWQDCGIVLATNCYYQNDIINSKYPTQAYNLGKSL